MRSDRPGDSAEVTVCGSAESVATVIRHLHDQGVPVRLVTSEPARVQDTQIRGGHVYLREPVGGRASRFVLEETGGES